MNEQGPYRRRGIAAGGALFVALMVLPVVVSITLLMVAGGIRGGSRLLAVRRRRRQTRTDLAADQRQLLLGSDIRSGKRVCVPLQALAAHGLVVGASGAGKTTTVMRLLAPQIAAGSPVIVIDLKGSPSLARDLELCATGSGRELRVWTLDGGAHWNPFAYGNPTELKDKVISTERFTEPHYKRAAERYLQLAIGVHQRTHGAGQLTLRSLVDLLEPPRLATAALALAPDDRERVLDYVNTLTPDQLSAVKGLGSRLALLHESDTGQFMHPADGQPQIDLRRALEGGEVVLFSLNSSSYTQLAGQIGTLAIQDLVSATGARLTAGAQAPQATVAIDEFSALGSENVLALLVRGREARVGVLLATQELTDLDRVARGLRDQVLGNTAVKIAHRQDVPASAAAISQLAGSTKRWEQTFTERGAGFGARSSHGRSARLIDSPLVEPEQVRTLATGEAVTIIKSPRSATHLTRVLPQPPAPGVTR